MECAAAGHGGAVRESYIVDLQVVSAVCDPFHTRKIASFAFKHISSQAGLTGVVVAARLLPPAFRESQKPTAHHGDITARVLQPCEICIPQPCTRATRVMPVPPLPSPPMQTAQFTTAAPYEARHM